MGNLYVYVAGGSGDQGYHLRIDGTEVAIIGRGVYFAMAVEAGPVEVVTEHQSKLFRGGSLFGRLMSGEQSLTVDIEPGQNHYVRGTLDEDVTLEDYNLKLEVVDEVIGDQEVRLLRRADQ